MAITEIMAMLVVVIPTTIFIITLLFDYWTLMRVDNQLKLIAHRSVTAINNAVDASTAGSALSSSEKTIIEDLCPPAFPVLAVSRVKDMPSGQIEINATITYSGLNHMDDTTLSTVIASYSYQEQNGSFAIECKK